MSASPRAARPVRVALLHNIISPHVVPLFAELARQPGIDLRVYFFAESDENRRWQANPEGLFRFTILRSVAIRTRDRDLATFFISPEIVPRLIRDGFDVVIAAGWDSFASLAAFLLCRLLGRPFILWSGSTKAEPSWRRTITLPMVKQLARRATACLAYGSRAREYLLRLGARPGKIFVSLNTIDMDGVLARTDAARQARDRHRALLGLDGARVVLYVGRLIGIKGVDTLIEAIANVRATEPRVTLVIAGYGPDETALKLLVSTKGLTDNVRFLGHVSLDELPRYYALADLFVLPSRQDVWGLVLNEAMAAGLPLITTDRVGGSADLIEPGGNGFVVPAGDVTALARAIEAIVTNAALAERMGRRSRELAEALRVSRTVHGVVDAIAFSLRRHHVNPASEA